MRIIKIIISNAGSFLLLLYFVFYFCQKFIFEILLFVIGLEPGQLISSTMIANFFLEQKKLDISSDRKRRKITQEDSFTTIDEELPEGNCFSCFCLPGKSPRKKK